MLQIQRIVLYGVDGQHHRAASVEVIEPQHRIGDVAAHSVAGVAAKVHHDAWSVVGPQRSQVPDEQLL